MDFDSLKRRRAAIKAKLTAFKNVVEKATQELNEGRLSDGLLAQLQHKLRVSANLIDDYETIQDKIDEIADDLDKQTDDRAAFKGSFFNTISIAKEIIDKTPKVTVAINDEAVAESGIATSSHSHSNRNVTSPSVSEPTALPLPVTTNTVKLPTIQLPNFNGAVEEWLEFRDTFVSLIHKNSAINNIQKFHYLRASVKSEATIILNSLEFTSDNYEIAWSALCERYNTNRLINTHLKALFTLERIEYESSLKLRNLVDSVSKNLRSLEALNLPVSHWDALIIYIVGTKLDHDTAREWEIHKVNKESPTLNDLKAFIRARADVIEQVETNKGEKTQKLKTKHTTTRSFAVSINDNCVVCKVDEHNILSCKEFQKLTFPARWETIRQLKLCSNCLRAGHFAAKCASQHFCKKCRAKHHTLLHDDNFRKAVAVSNNQTNNDAPNQQEQQQTSLFTSLSVDKDAYVLLATTTVKVLGKNGECFNVRALLDGCSQSNFITRECANRLALPTSKISFSISGINNALTNISQRCDVTIQSMHSNFTLELSCLVINKITDSMSRTKLKLNQTKIPNIKLADSKSSGNPAPLIC